MNNCNFNTVDSRDTISFSVLFIHENGMTLDKGPLGFGSTELR